MTPLPTPDRRRPAGLYPSALALGLVLLLVAWLIGGALGDRERQAERSRTEGDLAQLASRLELATARRLQRLQGLSAFIESQWGRPSFQADFDRYATELIRDTPELRALQWVEDGLIRQTVPLPGNEVALGYDLRTHPDPRAWPDVVAAMESEEEIVLSGPLNLVQGVRALVGRMSARDPEGRLLALAAVVFDLDPLLDEAGLGPPDLLRWQLLDWESALVSGDSTLAEVPVAAAVDMPNGQWTLLGAPAAGWGLDARAITAQVRLAGGLMALLLAGVLQLLLMRRATLTRLSEEQTRRQAEEKFRRLFHLIPAGVALTTLPDGRVIEVNDELLRLTGQLREDVVGRTTAELGYWMGVDREKVLTAVRRGGVVEGMPLQARIPGGIRDILYSGRVIAVDGQEALLSIVRDVTEERTIERQVAQAQRMEAVGELAGGVAHDFNNLLTVMLGHAEMIQRGREDDEDLVADTQGIRQAVRHGSELTRKLLALTRHRASDAEIVSLNDVVRSTLAMLRRVIGEHIAIQLALDSADPWVLMDPVGLEQILLNLTMNARDAMPAGGEVRIETSQGGGRVRLRVVDTGTGIDPAHLGRVFEPFFTTKGPGRGSGLGLAVCRGLIERAGGTIRIESALGRGTTVTVELPAQVATAVVGSQGAGARAEALGGDETLLLAEDERAVRALLERILRGRGYTVLSAPDGAAALQMAERHHGTIHLVITDVVMPGLRGDELASRLRQQRPGIRVLYLSGYAEESESLQETLDAGAGFLAKPFHSAELTRRIRALLDG